jgi:hypothetical protein
MYCSVADLTVTVVLLQGLAVGNVALEYTVPVMVPVGVLSVPPPSTVVPVAKATW